jgi:predicted ester cyclase
MDTSKRIPLQPVPAGFSPDVEAVARRLYAELWNQHRYDVAEEILDPEFTSNAAPGLRGSAAKLGAIRSYHQAFPDLTHTVEDVVGGPDRLAVRLTISGTDTGGFKGRPATGKALRTWVVDFLTFSDGRIIREWVGVDWLGALLQLGVVPDPWAAPG